jgi:hypothetical protein
MINPIVNLDGEIIEKNGNCVHPQLAKIVNDLGVVQQLIFLSFAEFNLMLGYLFPSSFNIECQRAEIM